MLLDRRQTLGALIGLCSCPSFLAWKRSAKAQQAESWWSTLHQDFQKALEAALRRVMPGAVEAGALAFVEYWMEQPQFSGMTHEWRVGAVLLNREAKRHNNKLFADSPAELQDAILTSFQQGAIKGKRFDSGLFFQQLVIVALESYLGDPKYGGNRQGIGWKEIGWHPCWWSPIVVDTSKRLPY